MGLIAYQMHKRKYLKEYEKDFIEFFKELIYHKEVTLRLFGVYNMPCFHQLYKDSQEQYDIDFAQLYQQCLSDESKVRRKTAKSLHEVFLMLQDEDTTLYKEMFIDLLTDTNQRILKTMN